MWVCLGGVFKQIIVFFLPSRCKSDQLQTEWWCSKASTISTWECRVLSFFLPSAYRWCPPTPTTHASNSPVCRSPGCLGFSFSGYSASHSTSLRNLKSSLWSFIESWCSPEWASRQLSAQLFVLLGRISWLIASVCHRTDPHLFSVR